ncbi:hypothetical protein Tco_0300893 [Tanacetum coccineum]
MFNRYQELASPEQTTSGKDFSNPLMADSLPKTICQNIAMKQGNTKQTATAKEISNPFMFSTDSTSGQIYLGAADDNAIDSRNRLNLDFEPKIDAMIRDFFEYVLETSLCFRERFTLMLLEYQDVILKFRSPSRWKELRKETSSKILPNGYGSRWKTFKPIARLTVKGKLK